MNLHRRTLIALAASLACAREIRSQNPDSWLELQGEHFTLRTDLPEEQARKAIADLEVVRAALLASGWHNARSQAGRTTVIELASARELQEFARKDFGGFQGIDAFGEPFILVTAEQDILEQGVVKHELAHVQNAGFLTSSPRWIQEGIACYLETLRFDWRKGQVVLGEPSPERLQYSIAHPRSNWFSVINTGDDFWALSGEAGFAFETGAWLIVHWMVDTQPEKFDAFLQRLAKGENPWVAFTAVFPDLHEEQLRAGIAAYLKRGSISIGRTPIPKWTGAIAVRRLPAAEVFALRSELFAHTPGERSPLERAQLSGAELQKALAVDAGNPLAVQLSKSADAGAAVDRHPDDWRSWVVAYDRHSQDPAAIQKAFALAPENAGVLYRLAFAEQGAGKGEQALQHAAHAVEVAPGRPDVLDALAQIEAANGHCTEAHDVEERAVEAFPDSAADGAPAALRARIAQIDASCVQRTTQSQVARQVLVQPVLKRCARAVPRAETARDAMTATFLIGEDGAVSAVAVKGNGSKALMAAFRRYVESCTFEPVVVDGKPRAMQSSLEMHFGWHK
ncbi:MAG TPA: hypothetical protein VLW85_19130 [Myxococcales bacterium]|nr:hypothetical protein [Myxococcales bacterium]